MKTPSFFRRLFGDRRTHDESVVVERRTTHKRKDVDDRLKNAVHDFEQTVRMRREDLFKRLAVNDVQQTVQFNTFRMICKHTLLAGEHRLCRHPDHEAANTGIAKCAEQVCPIMLAKVAA